MATVLPMCLYLFLFLVYRPTVWVQIFDVPGVPARHGHPVRYIWRSMQAIFMWFGFGVAYFIVYGFDCPVVAVLVRFGCG